MIYKIDDYVIKGNVIEFSGNKVFIDIDTLILKNKSFIYRSENKLDYPTITEDELSKLLKNNVDPQTEQDQIDELTILLANVIGGAL